MCIVQFFANLYNIVHVRTKQSGSPGPLRTVSCAVQPWPKSINLLERKITSKIGLCLRMKIRKKRLIL